MCSLRRDATSRPVVPMTPVGFELRRARRRCRPSSSVRISSLCWPSVGAGRADPAVDAASRNGSAGRRQRADDRVVDGLVVAAGDAAAGAATPAAGRRPAPPGRRRRPAASTASASRARPPTRRSPRRARRVGARRPAWSPATRSLAQVGPAEHVGQRRPLRRRSSTDTASQRSVPRRAYRPCGAAHGLRLPSRVERGCRTRSTRRPARRRC